MRDTWLYDINHPSPFRATLPLYTYIMTTMTNLKTSIASHLYCAAQTVL